MADPYVRGTGRGGKGRRTRPARPGRGRRGTGRRGGGDPAAVDVHALRGAGGGRGPRTGVPDGGGGGARLGPVGLGGGGRGLRRRTAGGAGRGAAGPTARPARGGADGRAARPAPAPGPRPGVRAPRPGGGRDPRGRRLDRLHLGHDGPAEGLSPHPREPGRDPGRHPPADQGRPGGLDVPLSAARPHAGPADPDHHAAGGRGVVLLRRQDRGRARRAVGGRPDPSPFRAPAVRETACGGALAGRGPRGRPGTLRGRGTGGRAGGGRPAAGRAPGGVRGGREVPVRPGPGRVRRPH